MNRFRPGDYLRIIVQYAMICDSDGAYIVPPWKIHGERFTVSHAIDTGDGEPFIITYQWGRSVEIPERFCCYAPALDFVI